MITKNFFVKMIRNVLLDDGLTIFMQKSLFYLLIFHFKTTIPLEANLDVKELRK